MNKYYKFFYAGEQDKEAIQFRKETGWNVIWASDMQGLNGDTWIIYRSIEDLPEGLQEYAAAQEKLSINMKKKTSIMLSALDKRLLELISEKDRRSQTAEIEYLIRQRAEELKIKEP